ncbi:gamma-hemolysin subunit A, partial [Staphylococcus aureus]
MLKNKILTTTLSVILLAHLANPLLENAKTAND